MKYLSECDLLVYDLHSGNPKDVELALAALKKFNFEEEKVLILISSLMVWNKTPPKLKEVGGAPPVEGAAEGGEPPAEDAIPEEAKGADESAVLDGSKILPPVEPEKPKKYIQVPYVEEDFRQRVPSEEYEEIKRIEDELLAFKKDNVRIYILASGIMYGAGESILESHLKRAWL
jgi:hypothetical protein